MFCMKCGNEMKSTDYCCPKCGFSYEDDDSAYEQKTVMLNLDETIDHNYVSSQPFMPGNEIKPAAVYTPPAQQKKKSLNNLSKKERNIINCALTAFIAVVFIAAFVSILILYNG